LIVFRTVIPRAREAHLDRLALGLRAAGFYGFAHQSVIDHDIGSGTDCLAPPASCSPFTPTPISIILNGASAKKAWATMASKTSKAEPYQPVIDMAELGARIALRRAELGITDADIPRNTESKEALLKAIKDAGGDW
jgi:hypothetical protein